MMEAKCRAWSVNRDRKESCSGTSQWRRGDNNYNWEDGWGSKAEHQELVWMVLSQPGEPCSGNAGMEGREPSPGGWKCDSSAQQSHLGQRYWFGDPLQRDGNKLKSNDSNRAEREKQVWPHTLQCYVHLRRGGRAPDSTAVRRDHL